MNFAVLCLVGACFNTNIIIRTIFESFQNCFFQYGWLFLRLCLNIGVSLLQCDRFLAIYLHLRYKDLITTKMAIVSIIIGDMVAFSVVTIVYFHFPSYSNCPKSPHDFRLEDANIIFDAVPSLFVALALLSNIIYGYNIRRKHEQRISTNIMSMDTENNGIEDEGVKNTVYKLAKLIIDMNLVTSIMFVITVPDQVFAIIEKLNKSTIDVIKPITLIYGPFRIPLLIYHMLLFSKNVDALLHQQE